MNQPRYKLGDKVQVTADYAKEDLRRRVGFVADPGDHLRHAKPRWPATYWKEDAHHIYYWIEFTSTGHERGELLAGEIDEQHLAPV